MNAAFRREARVTKKTKTIRIGIMGTGWPGRTHTEAFQKLPGAAVVAVSEPIAERRAAFIEKFGAMSEFDDYRDMIRQGGLDAVVNALPTGMHYATTRVCLEAGLHVLCEKPPTTTAAEMIALARLARRTRRVYMFCRQPRFEPKRLEARRLVAAGALGEVYAAESAWIRCRGIPWGAGGWFVNKAKGGGVLLDLGIHVIDNVWFVMGCPRPVEVMAGLYCAFSNLAPKGITYTAEDAVMGQIRFANGAMLRIMTSFALNTGGPGVQEASGKVRPEWGEARLYGTRAGLDIMAGKLVTGARDGVRVKPLAPRSTRPPFEVQGKSFLDAITRGTPPANSADQAVMLMQMLDALKKSGETGRAVRIPPR
jgi:predicted dehydrogenase